MAGLTKSELAGKTAYLTSTDPAPEKPWVDLTPEERQAWIDGTAAPETAGKPAAGAEDPTPEESTDPVGDVVATDETPGNDMHAAGAEDSPASTTGDAGASVTLPVADDAMPMTEPDKGDLTPIWAEWYLAKHGRAAFTEKYKGREQLLPAHLLEGGAE